MSQEPTAGIHSKSQFWQSVWWTVNHQLVNYLITAFTQLYNSIQIITE